MKIILPRGAYLLNAPLAKGCICVVGITLLEKQKRRCLLLHHIWQLNRSIDVFGTYTRHYCRLKFIFSHEWSVLVGSRELLIRLATDFPRSEWVKSVLIFSERPNKTQLLCILIWAIWRHFPAGISSCNVSPQTFSRDHIPPSDFSSRDTFPSPIFPPALNLWINYFFENLFITELLFLHALPVYTVVIRKMK